MNRTIIHILSFLILALSLSSTLHATGIPVVDAAHIASNRVSHAVDYVQQVLHEANQQTQITKQIEQITQLYEQIDQLYEQIAQMDDYLERFGDPKSILNLAGVKDLLAELGRATDGLDIEAKLPDITGEDWFGYDGSGIFQPIKPTITIGEEEFKRDAERYKPNDAVRATIEQYREKKVDVVERRDRLRGEIAETTGQLQSAETDSEVKKLTGVLLGQQTELQAIDSELDIARGDAESRALENENQTQAEAKARTEESARRFEEGNRADVETYKLDRSSYGW
ncbi:MAG: hypothetical protein R3F19_12395 [Verrucomicrobiales bacterium]